MTRVPERAIDPRPERTVDYPPAMYRGGHIGLNALLYAPFVAPIHRYGSLELAVSGAILVFGLANLPDVDQPLPRCRHRGPTHTVWFAVLVGLVTGAGMTIVGASPFAFQFGFLVGTACILAHLAGDVVTPMGISPFAPLSGFHVTLDWFASKNGRINRAFFIVGSIALLASMSLAIGRSGVAVPTIWLAVDPETGGDARRPRPTPRHRTDRRPSDRHTSTPIAAAQSSAVAVGPCT